MLVSRTVAALTSVFLLAPLAAAQDSRVVKGSGADLEGVTHVYLDTGADVALNELVASQLREQLPDLVVVNHPAPNALVVRMSRGYTERRDLGDAFANVDSPIAPNVETLQPRVRGSMRSGRQRPKKESPDNQEEIASLSARPRMVREWYAFGSALVPSGADTFVEVFSYRQLVRRGYEGPTKDFVRKLAKEYRKANRRK